MSSTSHAPAMNIKTENTVSSIKLQCFVCLATILSESLSLGGVYIFHLTYCIRSKFHSLPRGYIQKNSCLVVLNNFFPKKHKTHWDCVTQISPDRLGGDHRPGLQDTWRVCPLQADSGKVPRSFPRQGPREGAPVWPSTSEQRPTTDTPTPESSGLEIAGRTPALCLSPASCWKRGCLFLACSLTHAAKAVPKGYLPS